MMVFNDEKYKSKEAITYWKVLEKNDENNITLIECNLETLHEIEHTFKFNDAIIRHLVFGTKEPVTSQSPMMKEEKSKSLVGDNNTDEDTKKENIKESAKEENIKESAKEEEGE